MYVLEDREGAEPIGSKDALVSDAAKTPFALGWSPDGRRIAFLTEAQEKIEFRVVPAAGGQDAVVGVGAPFYWAWMPDARSLLAHVGGAETGARLVFMDPDEPGASVDGGSNLARPGFFQAPAISPDGRHLAYGARASGRRRRVIIESTSEAEPEDQGSLNGDAPVWVPDQSAGVTIPHEGQVALAWSPKSDKIAFISPPFDLPVFYGPLRMHDMESGQTRTLSDDIVVAFFWSPDGRGIAYLKPLTDGDLPSAVDEMEALRLGPDAELESELEALSSALGSGAMHVSLPLQRPRGPQLELWWLELDTGERRRISTFRPPVSFVTQFLPFFDQYSSSHTLWSPDGSAIVLPFSLPGEPPMVHVVPLEGEPRPLAQGVFGVWSTVGAR